MFSKFSKKVDSVCLRVTGGWFCCMHAHPSAGLSIHVSQWRLFTSSLVIMGILKKNGCWIFSIQLDIDVHIQSDQIETASTISFAGPNSKCGPLLKLWPLLPPPYRIRPYARSAFRYTSSLDSPPRSQGISVQIVCQTSQINIFLDLQTIIAKMLWLAGWSYVGFPNEIMHKYGICTFRWSYTNLNDTSTVDWKAFRLDFLFIFWGQNLPCVLSCQRREIEQCDKSERPKHLFDFVHKRYYWIVDNRVRWKGVT